MIAMPSVLVSGVPAAVRELEVGFHENIVPEVLDLDLELVPPIPVISERLVVGISALAVILWRIRWRFLISGALITVFLISGALSSWSSSSGSPHAVSSLGVSCS
jgi:hypothetical protein